MAQEINHHAENSHAAAQSASAQPTPHAQSKPKSGLTIAGFVLAIVAVATSFIPIVNNLSALVAVVGFVLAIVGTVSCAKGKRSGKGLGIAAIAINVVAFMVVLATQSLYSSAIQSAANDISTPASDSQPQAAQNAVADSSSDSSSSRYAVSIDGCRIANDYKGNPAAIVTCTWTNNSDSDISFAAAVSAKAFQDDVQLDSAVINSSQVDGYDSGTTLKDVKPGASQTVQMAYELSDQSTLTFECSEYFASKNAKLATQTFEIA